MKDSVVLVYMLFIQLKKFQDVVIVKKYSNVFIKVKKKIFEELLNSKIYLWNFPVKGFKDIMDRNKSIKHFVKN